MLIDLPGMVEALRSRSNAKAAVIDAIQDGSMHIIRSVSDILQSSYPDLYKDFRKIRPKKYATPNLKDDAVAASLQESFQGSIGQGIPTYEQFQIVALAKRMKCRLITAGNGLSRCESIAIKCKLPHVTVGNIQSV